MTVTRPDSSVRFVHQAFPYEGDAGFVDVLAPFCTDGLSAGDRVLAVTSPRNQALLRDALGDAATQVEFTDAAAWYQKPGQALADYHRYLGAHSDGRRRIRVIGEPVWDGRGEVHDAEWTRYESVLNAAFAASPAWIVCPYDVGSLAPEIVADACRTHPEVIAGGSALPSDTYTDPSGFTHRRDEQPLPAPPAHAFGLEVGGALITLRDDITGWARRLELDPDLCGRLVLAANELAANTRDHGSGQGRLHLWADPSTVWCELAEAGKLDRPFPGYLPPPPYSTRGHGLWMIRQLCDFVEIRTDDQGTRIRLHLARP